MGIFDTLPKPEPHVNPARDKKKGARLRKDQAPDLAEHAARSNWTPSRHRRPTRRRNMPGAVQRRLIAARKAWATNQA